MVSAIEELIFLKNLAHLFNLNGYTYWRARPRLQGMLPIFEKLEARTYSPLSMVRTFAA